MEIRLARHNWPRSTNPAPITVIWLSLMFGMGYATHLEAQNIFALSDSELIHTLTSTDKETSYAAVREIMRRGDRMDPLLLQSKGNKQPFYGYGLGDRESAFLVPLLSGDAKRDRDRIVTIEVAALYLISAIFYYNLEFASAPYLDDGTPIKEHRFNTVKRVSAAWEAVETWYQRVQRSGLVTMRSKKDSPLRSGKVRFWANVRNAPIQETALVINPALLVTILNTLSLVAILLISKAIVSAQTQTF